MKNPNLKHKFTFDLELVEDVSSTISGWREFAESVVHVVNALNTVASLPSREAFVCGETDITDRTANALPNRSDMEAVEEMFGTAYDALIQLPNPFAHLVAWVSELAAHVFQSDDHTSVAKSTCAGTLLVLQGRLMSRYVSETGFTARA